MKHWACGCGNYAIWTHLGPPSNTWRCPKCGEVVTEREDEPLPPLNPFKLPKGDA